MVDLDRLEPFDEAGLSFYRELRGKFGADKAGEAFRALSDVLGSSWNAKILQYLMVNGSVSAMRFNYVPQDRENIIPIVKEIRWRFGLGLKDAKDIYDKLCTGHPHTLVYVIPDEMEGPVASIEQVAMVFRSWGVRVDLI